MVKYKKKIIQTIFFYYLNNFFLHIPSCIKLLYMIIYTHRTVKKKKKKIHIDLKIKIIKLNTYNRYQNILQTLKYTSSLMKTINNLQQSSRH